MKSRTPSAPDLHVCTDGGAGNVAPGRLLDGSGSDWERRLVASAAIDRVPAASITRLAQALQVPRAALPPVAPSGIGAASPFVKAASLAGLGAIGLAIMAAVQHAPEPKREQAGAAVTVAASTPATNHTRPPRMAAAPAQPPTSSPPTSTTPSNALADASRPPTKAALARTANEARTQRTRDGLRAELSALESVQRALRAGETAAAAQALENYAARFPTGELAPQAELLGADIALARSKQREGAIGAPPHMKGWR